jgi:hypothetical protein
MADQIDIIVADLDLFVRGEIVALGLNMVANLQESPPLGTPVDTGWARANWIPSVAEPNLLPSAVPEGVRKAGGPDGDPSFRGQAAEEIAERAKVADQGLNDVLAWKLEDGPIFAANSVPYIEALNSGHSQQSPEGFVQDALEKAVRETYSAGASKASRLRRAGAARETGGKPTDSTAKQAFDRARARRAAQSQSASQAHANRKRR